MLVWDITCPDTLAPSYTALSTREAGAVAAEMERRKREKHVHLDPSHFFVLIAVKTLGAMRPEAGHFSETLDGGSQLPFQSHCHINISCSGLQWQSNVAMQQPSSGLQRGTLLLNTS